MAAFKGGGEVAFSVVVVVVVVGTGAGKVVGGLGEAPVTLAMMVVMLVSVVVVLLVVVVEFCPGSGELASS